MSKKEKVSITTKAQIIFEVEEGQTNCCECVFGGTCPYACAFANLLDCSKLNLKTLKVVKYEKL